MPQIQNEFSFKPDGDALRIWLGTRKNTLSTGGPTLNGLFTDADIATDTGWVILVIALELLGAFGIIQGTQGDEDSLLWLFGAVVFVVLDVMFAIFLHSKVGVRCYYDAHIDLLRPFENTAEYRLESDQLKEKRKDGYFWDIFHTGMIFVIASAKIFAITVGNSKVTENWVIVLIIMYLITAYVHIRHTGYFVWYSLTKSKFNSQYKKAKAGLTSNPPNPFQSKYQLKEKHIDSPGIIARVGHINASGLFEGHKVKIGTPSTTEDNGIIIYNYLIETLGVLTDEHIKTLISGELPTNTYELAYHLRREQLRMVSLKEFKAPHIPTILP